MFRKLKLQFIITNMAIIAILFVSLTAGVYILLQINMLNNAEMFSKRIAEGINSGMWPEVPPHHDRVNEQSPAPASAPIPVLPGPANAGRRPPEPPSPPTSPGQPGLSTIAGPMPERGRFLPKVFFTKTDAKGNLTFHLVNMPSEKSYVAALTYRVFKNYQNTGIINFLQSKYFFYKTPLKKGSGTLIVFQDLKQEKNVQFVLVLSLTVIGVVFLILSLVGGAFMANRAIAPIQKTWEQQKEFLADASHELRTPLAVIQTNLEVVAGNPDESVASQKVWLDNVHEELQQMTVLVSSLLFLSRVDSQQNKMDKKVFSLDNLIRRVRDSFQPVAAAKNIDLQSAISGEISYCGDEPQIRQVIEGLLDNAIRHTPEGGRILLGLDRLGKTVVVTFSDTGEGIPAEHLEKIFDRFYQADPSRSKGKAGLGLSIAKCIIENHGGTIRATSEPGNGATFIIRLPLFKKRSL